MYQLSEGSKGGRGGNGQLRIFEGENEPFRGISLQNLFYCIGPMNPSKSLLLQQSSDGRKPGGAYLDDDKAFGGEDSERYTWVRSPPRLVNGQMPQTDASICGRSSGI